MGRRKKLPQASHTERRLQQVHLVQPPVGGAREDVGPPLGLLQLAAVLEQDDAEREVHIVDLNLSSKLGGLDGNKPLRTQFVRALPKRSSQIDLVGVTTWSYNFDVTMELVEALYKKHPHAPIVLGGPHVTFVDEEVLRTFESVAYVVRDEGDWTFPRLLRAIEGGCEPEELGAIPGLTWRGPDGAVVRNPSGGVVEDLDSLPYPAYHLIDPQAYLACHPVLVVEAGRGCPYNCNFCSTTNMFQRKYRVKTPARLVDEVEHVMAKTGTNRFELLHDNLVAKKSYVVALCREIRARNLDVDWSCTSRTDNLTEEVAEEMFLAGCESIFFGVESMAKERQAWTGKKLKPDKVEAAMALTRRQHITPSMGIILGFPEETPDELDLTLEAAIRWTTDPEVRGEVSTAILRYYPGADLFQHADRLQFDALAATDACAVPGYSIRPEWREKTSLFPLQSIHTDPEHTRRNIVRRDIVRTLLRVCPNTLRACLEILGFTPHALVERLSAGREFAFLRTRDRRTMWNEVLRALAEVVVAKDSAEVRELFTCEVPFWEGEPVAAPMDRLEHVIRPKQYQQDDLLELARGRRQEPPRPMPAGHSILSVRAGPAAVVWFTDKAEALLATFQESFARDRRGTIEYVNSLQQGM